MAKFNAGDNVAQAGLEFLLECSAILQAAHKRGATMKEMHELYHNHLAKVESATKLIIALDFVVEAAQQAQIALAPLSLKEIVLDGKPMPQTRRPKV